LLFEVLSKGFIPDCKVLAKVLHLRKYPLHHEPDPSLKGLPVIVFKLEPKIVFHLILEEFLNRDVTLTLEVVITERVLVHYANL
jgi:hypothetical protein